MKFCIYFIYLATIWLFYSGAEKVRYVTFEQPKLLYLNKKYVRHFNISSRRLGRSDPFYYVDIHLESVTDMNNNLTANFYFYEQVGNSYRQSFLEMHWKWCDLVFKDKFFGYAIRRGTQQKLACPLPAGAYHFCNMTIPMTQMPANFPFTKGRIYANATKTSDNELIGHGYISIEIREKIIKNNKQTKKN